MSHVLIPASPPPMSVRLPIGLRLLHWAHGHPVSLALWILLAFGTYQLGGLLFNWAVLNATWSAPDRAGCNPDGACWAFIINRLPQFAFGFFPEELRWRAWIVLLAPLILLVHCMTPSFKGRMPLILRGFGLYPVLGPLLLAGGFLGLEAVPATLWGGLLLTVLVGTICFTLSFPIGILFALGRVSKLPIVRILSTGFIEVWRGLPLVAILFMSVIMVPLMLPPGTEFPRLALAMTGITLYSSAYLAEVVRGGLQGLEKGQGEAASAVGFGFWGTQIYIVLPQALRSVLAGIVNAVIALIKDTTYVIVVGLFDFLNIVTAALADARWLGLTAEGYIFVGIVYWIICFTLSKVSAELERRSPRNISAAV